MSRNFGSVVVALVALVTPFAAFSAGPLPALDRATGASAIPGLAEPVHGFHCRKELGWDPRTGVYRMHRHEGICRDYKRCMREMYRCNLLMGRGWDAYNYERWGWDTGRFNQCMLEANCY